MTRVYNPETEKSVNNIVDELWKLRLSPGTAISRLALEVASGEEEDIRISREVDGIDPSVLRKYPFWEIVGAMAYRRRFEKYRRDMEDSQAREEAFNLVYNRLDIPPEDLIGCAKNLDEEDLPYPREDNYLQQNLILIQQAVDELEREFSET